MMNKGDIIYKRYRIEEILGEGGYGHVYLTFDLRKKIHYALKISKGTDIKEQQRFEQEIEILKQLKHDAIIPIYDTFTYQDKFCYIMKYVPGYSFDFVTRKSTKMSPKKIVQLIKDVAYGLGHAHKQDIIHRDIKPANILYHEEEKKAYITDFGLAKQIGAENLTATGQIVGTPYYLSPEQARGESISAQSDIYSLGATLYHILAKCPVFEDHNRAALIQKIANVSLQPISIREHNENLPASLEAICMKAIAKTPEKRYVSMEAFAEDLERYISNQKPLAPMTSSLVSNKIVRFVKQHKLLLTSCSVILGGVIGGWQYREIGKDLEKQNKIVEEKIEDYKNRLVEIKSFYGEEVTDEGNIEKRIERYITAFSRINQIREEIKKSSSEKLGELRQEHDKLLLEIVPVLGEKKNTILFDFYNLSPEKYRNILNYFEEETREKINERMRILQELQEKKSISNNNKKIIHGLEQKIGGDIDRYYKARSYMVVAEQCREYAHELYSQLFLQYSSQLREEQYRHQYFVDYRSKELWARISGIAIQRQAVKDKKFKQFLVNGLTNSFKMMREDIYSFYNFEEKVGEVFSEKEYPKQLMKIFLYYQWSQYAYRRALYTYDTMLKRYPQSPLLTQEYFKVLEGLATTTVGGDKYEHNIFLFRSDQYMSNHGILEDEIQQLYTTFGIIGGIQLKKNTGQALLSKTEDYLKKFPERSPALLIPFHQYLVSLDDEELIREKYVNIYSMIFKYGTDKEKARFLYQSMWYREHKGLYKRAISIMNDRAVQHYMQNMLEKPHKDYTPYILDMCSSYVRTIARAKQGSFTSSSLKLLEQVLTIDQHTYRTVGAQAPLQELVYYMEKIALKMKNKELVEKVSTYKKQK